MNMNNHQLSNSPRFDLHYAKNHAITTPSPRAITFYAHPAVAASQPWSSHDPGAQSLRRWWQSLYLHPAIPMAMEDMECVMGSMG